MKTPLEIAVEALEMIANNVRPDARMVAIATLYQIKQASVEDWKYCIKKGGVCACQGDQLRKCLGG